MNPEQQWQDAKEAYLRQIEKSLAKTDHPRRAEILSDVTEHLERKYAELAPAERTWETCQRIITEMGPPEDYAELLTEERMAERNRFGINELLAIIFVVTLIAIGAYLVYTAKTTPSQPEHQKARAYQFEMDEQVIGKWKTMDFVEAVEDFAPLQKSWRGKIYLLEMQFNQDGTYWAKDNDKEYGGVWTKGRVNPDVPMPAGYLIKTIAGKDYLFYEWISGDVTIRGMKPWYYVLAREE